MEETLEKSTQFKCPGCGARPVWDPSSAGMKCPFCGTASEVPHDTTPPLVYDIRTAPTADMEEWGDQKRVVKCGGCGAQTILGRDESASFCPFCGSPQVLEDQARAGIAPESVIPFCVPMEQAVRSFRTWLKGKLFAPGKAKKMASLGQILGVYMPHWAYNSHTRTHYTGQAGYHYYVDVPVTVERNGKKVTETRREQRTRWEPTSGYVEKQFLDILIPGSQRLPQRLLKQVQPFDLRRLCRYQPGFLSGFLAEKAAVDVQQGWTEAQDVIRRTMQDMARQDILSHADEAQVSSIDSEHDHVRYKLSLLPMYISSFAYKDKSYHVLVNGQTGQCGGEAPVSVPRVILAVLLVAAVIGGIVYLWMSR